MVSRRAIQSITVVAILFSCLGASPCRADQAAGLQQKLEAKYVITKTTDDKTDIVTAGSVLILEKDKLLMYATTTGAPPQNTYKDGRLSSGAFGLHEKAQGFGSFIGHPPPKTVTTRYYVTGEKFWVTRIDLAGRRRRFHAVHRCRFRYSVLLHPQIYLSAWRSAQHGPGVEHGR